MGHGVPSGRSIPKPHTEARVLIRIGTIGEQWLDPIRWREVYPCASTLTVTDGHYKIRELGESVLGRRALSKIVFRNARWSEHRRRQCRQANYRMAHRVDVTEDCPFAIGTTGHADGWTPIGSSMPVLVTAALSFVLQHAMVPDGLLKTLAASGARDENEKNKTRHAARKPRTQSALCLGPSNPTSDWMLQMARNATNEISGSLRGRHYLLHDRDSLALSPRSPNRNAFAERWVGSTRQECLSRLILFGEASLRRALTEYIDHHHFERNHQGKGNLLLFPSPEVMPIFRAVHPRDRLGGLLKFYSRAA